MSAAKSPEHREAAANMLALLRVTFYQGASEAYLADDPSAVYREIIAHGQLKAAVYDMQDTILAEPNQ
jgi:hypothetical protein